MNSRSHFMNSRSHFLGKPIAIASVFLAALLLVACEQSKPAASAPTEPAQTKASSLAASTERVFVVFDGPWAFATDPKDPNTVLAIAPKTKSHRDLQVSASNKATVPAGTYDLSVPAHSTLTAGTPDSTFVQASIDAKSLEHALAAKSERYVIRLPKPEAYAAAMRYRSRVGASYPPDPSTERDYVTSASLRYSVSSLTGFSLAGTPDSGIFNPLLLQVDTPTITFLIDPSIGDLPLDSCYTHSREAFRDLTKLLGITLYVDFPGGPSGCRDKDPQKPRATKTESAAPRLERLAALLEGNLTDTPMSSAGAVDTMSDTSFLTGSIPRTLAHRLLATLYLFGTHTGNCKAPILILKTTQ
jgi:hypothetical protein